MWIVFAAVNSCEVSSFTYFGKKRRRMPSAAVVNGILMVNMMLWVAAINHAIRLWADLADDKLMIFFLFFLKNKIQHFMQIVS